MTRDCGGCEGVGRHWRWCPEAVGHSANRWGALSEHVGSLADQVGSNETGAANHLYAAASLLLKKARAAADEYADSKA